jgi:signal transduction histidine kinase/ActR/RegA family two-component response regulator
MDLGYTTRTRPRSASTLQREQLVVAAALVGAVALGAYAVIHLALGVAPIASALALCSGFVTLTPSVLRRSKSVVAAANWGVGWSFVAVAFTATVGGGLLSPALQFFSVLVLAAVLLAGVRSGAFWAAAGICWTVMLYVYEAAGGVLPTLVDTAHIATMWLPTTVGILVITLVTAALYAYYERKALGALKLSNEALSTARDLAESGLRARNSFVAHMSHEIRTPMNAVIGLTDVLLRGDATPRQREHLLAIRDSGEHLLAIINDVLDLSKIEARRLEFEARPFDVEECARSAAQMLSLAASDKGIALRVDLDAAAGLAVVGDAGRLRQVMVNLLSNAVKFTDAGEVSFHIVARPAGARVELTITVRDTGIGIEPDKIRRIFEPFTQGDASTTRRFGGTGLGLVISRLICESMGGTLTVQSAPGAGSTFTARVRLARALSDGVLAAPDGANSQSPPAHSDDQAPAPAVDEAPARAGDLDAEAAGARDVVGAAAVRILLVDDNPLNQSIAVEMMEILGYQPDVAGDGFEALAALEERRYDVVFMDVQMPNMDGLTAARHIRARWPDGEGPHIVAMTASAQAEDRAACIEAGMNDHLAKPYRLDDLRDRLAAFVARR